MKRKIFVMLCCVVGMIGCGSVSQPSNEQVIEAEEEVPQYIDCKKVEFAELIDSIRQNKEEALVEMFGMVLFERLRGNKQANDSLKAALDSRSDKDEAMLQVFSCMLIDIEESYTNYSDFVKDFPAFENFEEQFKKIIDESLKADEDM